MSSYTKVVHSVTVDRKLWELLESMDADADSNQHSQVFNILKSLHDGGRVTETEKETLKLAHSRLFVNLPIVAEGVGYMLRMLDDLRAAHPFPIA